ncbi:LuxE/PaaK family acyltransferase [Robiginitalea sp. IMCC43444]|uniref:LuxE/PaaK family acyltransferase n=1 Tax=Robiginitalea sp. IMCC43444 TaxID=3459121 RepID=UPI004042AFB1
MHPEQIFQIENEADFQALCLKTFQNQYEHLEPYREFCDYLGRKPSNTKSIENIPFLPIEFFKTHSIIQNGLCSETVFTSSGTTGSKLSRHPVADLQLYRESFLKAFELFYGPVQNFCILALLPSYQERPGSSLIYMVSELIRRSGHPQSGFVTADLKTFSRELQEIDDQGCPVLLIGVSFALLDLAQNHPLSLQNTIAMETGGMKGRRKEMVREELHKILCRGLGLPGIHSEYGMTELLSQAYSKGNGLFQSPPWMRVLLRDTEDPLSFLELERTGGINIIDLANQHSCSFLATQDLGRLKTNGQFEVLGRFDHSDIRGCNLMAL